MHHLFICSANKQRSKTAGDYFAARYPDLDILSAGTNLRLCRQEGTTPLSKDLLQWADHIWVMEPRHRDHIKKSWGSTYYTKKHRASHPRPLPLLRPGVDQTTGGEGGVLES